MSNRSHLLIIELKVQMKIWYDISHQGLDERWKINVTEHICYKLVIQVSTSDFVQ